MAFRLTQATIKLQNENRQQPGRHMDALQKLASIFQQETVNSDANDSPVVQISYTPTAPKLICATSITHVLTPHVRSLLQCCQSAKHWRVRYHLVPRVVSPPIPRVKPTPSGTTPH